MHQLIVLGGAGVIAWFGYRALTREAKRVSERARRSEDELRTGAQGTLVRDPETGEYHLDKK